MASEMSMTSRVETLISLAPSGFAMAFHVNYTRPAFLIQNYPSEWTRIYSARGFVMADPTVKWGFENVGNIRWSDLVALDSEGVLAAAAEHGLIFGLTHVVDNGGTRSMTSFARADREFSEDEVAQIATEVDAIHADSQADKALSDKDLAALRKMTKAVTQA